MHLQMSTVLANLVVRLCGFHDIHDSHTEIDKQHLTNAIPYLMVIRPQLVDRYKYNIRQCYKKGIHSHRDAAKILRRKFCETTCKIYIHIQHPKKKYQKYN